MWIIKLGGSWLTNPNLKDFIKYIENFKKEPLVMIVGGGMYADAVRLSQKYIGFDDNFANLLALKATETYAIVINKVFPNIKLTSKLNLLKSKKNIKIWLPSKCLINSKDFKRDWNSTSDSVACWLNKKIKAKGVLFIKSISFEKEKSLKIKTLQKKEILDKNIMMYVKKSNCLKIIGPEIINLLKEKKNWSDVIKKTKNVKL